MEADMAAKQIETYRIHYYSGPDNFLSAVILLSSNNIGVGRINFIKDGNAIRANREIANGILVINFHESKFSEILDLLRNETPLFIDLNTQHGIGSIQTDNEPIGEDE